MNTSQASHIETIVEFDTLVNKFVFKRLNSTCVC